MVYAKDVLDKINEMKIDSDSIKVKKNKGIISGTFIGMAGGLLIGFSRNYNLISSAVVGSLLGAIVSYISLNQFNKDE
jgi:galactitol-specific phosphotransferase system IIC component